MWQCARSCRKDLGEIDHRVASDGKRELSLFRAGLFNAGDRQCTSVENRCEGSDPGLVVVLGTEVGQHRIREMAFHELRAPELPVFQQDAQGFVTIRETVATKEFAGGGRRACAGIEQGDIDLALGEGTVDKREIADDGGEKAKTESSFGHHQQSRQARAGNNIAEAESEERSSAEIQVRVQAVGLAGEIDGGTRAVLHHTERDHKSDRPDPDQDKQRDRAIKTKKRLASFPRRDDARKSFPRAPRGAVVEAGETKFSGHAPRENNGFEGVPNNNQEQRHAGDEHTWNRNHA